MNALLVLTTGQTDVQFVEDGTRRELKKDKIALLHDDLERRMGQWFLVDSPTSKGTPTDSLPQEVSFDLCTPKLDAVLRYAHDNDIVVTSALILETRRKANIEPRDPRYSGAILEQRLQTKGILDIFCCAYLKDDDGDYDNKDNERDAIIRRTVVARIDEAVRTRLERGNFERIVLATTGGFPIINTLVNEIVRFHAPSTIAIASLEVPDRSRKDTLEPDVAISRSAVPEPAESFRARKNALDLIGKGNLLGAWGAVQHLHSDEIERQWTRVIKWLACFAASLPIPEECDIDVLNDEHMPIRAALRVEFALRSGDIPRAVHGTVAFLESALWYHLKDHVRRHEDPKRRRLYQVNPSPLPALIRIGEGHDDDRGKPFEVKTQDESGAWYHIHDDKVGSIRLAKYYLKKPALIELAQAVSDDVRNLRNDTAHNEPTPQLMNEARNTMVNVKLWSEDDRFLVQPLVQNVLRELGEQNSNNLCADLISSVRLRLLYTP